VAGLSRDHPRKPALVQPQTLTRKNQRAWAPGFRGQMAPLNVKRFAGKLFGKKAA
jgi:hypothetical protein